MWLCCLAPFLFAFSLFASSPFFIPIKEIHPGQLRYSRLDVDRTCQKQIGLGRVQRCEGRWLLPYGKSLYPLKQSHPAILTPRGWVLVDGHHRLLASKRLGATLYPIHMVADLRGRFDWEECALANGWIYPFDFQGRRRQLPCFFSGLINDPNRHFASMSKGKKTMCGIKGSSHPLWIIEGRTRPFEELRVATALWKQGLVYDPKTSGEAFFEAASKALLEEKIPGVQVVLPKEKQHGCSDRLAPAP